MVPTVNSLIKWALDRFPPWLWWALLGAWAVGIFGLSGQSHLVFMSDAVLDFVLRKAGHLAVFAVLAALAWLALSGSGVRRAAWWALIGASVYAASDEIHQGFVTGRTPFVGDVLIDIGGVVLGLFIVQRLVRRLVRELP